MTTREQYRRAYQCLRALQNHGWEASYWGSPFLSGEIDPRIIGLAAMSLAAYHQDDPLEKRFVYRCQFVRPEYTDGKTKWVYSAYGDGIPF